MPVLSFDDRLQDHHCPDCSDDPIVVALVNNMPDSALRTTEQQFRELLGAASNNVAVRLRLFSLPELPRSQAGRSHIEQYYEDFNKLWASQIDGLIVTGTEPRAPALTDEPYWATLRRLVDWAEDQTLSAIWSCLAAHAVVLHRDGIVRRALPEKLVGVFDCTKAGNHAIVFDAPARWRVPHSRNNDIPGDALLSKGYRIISSSADAGVDVFVAQRRSLFVFFQGHLEYDPGALLREYRRDIGRFLAGKKDSYPKIPHDYVDDDTAKALTAYRDATLRNREIDPLSRFPTVLERKLAHSWRPIAICIYANWLSYLTRERARIRKPSKIGCPDGAQAS
jgi:homoserine O-succinyltransferase